MSALGSARRPRRRSENKPPLRLALSGLLVLVAAVGFVWFGVRSVSGVPGVEYRTLYADIPDISNLRPHDEVRVGGVRVGQVLDQQVRDGRALIEIQLQPGTGRLRADSEVVVRARGLLGSRYLELRPGRRGPFLEEGATIRARPVTSLTNGVADVLDVFDAETRGGLGSFVGELGQGVAGRGAKLNELIGRAPGMADQLTRVADSIEAREGAARRILPSLHAGMAALDGARDEIAELFRAGAAGMRPFADGREAMQDVLEQAPGTLHAAETGLGEGRRLLAATRSLAVALDRTLDPAPSALRTTNALLRESPEALRRAEPLLRALGPAVPSVLDVTAALRPNLTPLRRAFDDLLPLLRTVGDHRCDVENFADNWRSVLGYGAPSSRAIPGGDAGNFNQLRVHVLGSQKSLGSVLPGASLPFNRSDVYEPPCTRSPGPKYSSFGVGAPKGGGR